LTPAAPTPPMACLCSVVACSVPLVSYATFTGATRFIKGAPSFLHEPTGDRSIHRTRVSRTTMKAFILLALALTVLCRLTAGQLLNEPTSRELVLLRRDPTKPHHSSTPKNKMDYLPALRNCQRFGQVARRGAMWIGGGGKFF